MVRCSEGGEDEIVVEEEEEGEDSEEIAEDEEIGKDLCNCTFSLAYGARIPLNNAMVSSVRTVPTSPPLCCMLQRLG